MKLAQHKTMSISTPTLNQTTMLSDMCVINAIAGERKSKRARKGRGPMTVSSTTTLGEVKLRLIEVLGLHPSNAALYVRGALVDGDGRTLAGASSRHGNRGWWQCGTWLTGRRASPRHVTSNHRALPIAVCNDGVAIGTGFMLWFRVKRFAVTLRAHLHCLPALERPVPSSA
jgi:hypothetical protein